MSGSGEAAYIDDDVAVLIDRKLPGVVVAPRSHVAVLAMTPRSAVVLAAVRRAALHVEAWYEPASVEIAPVSDAPGAAGHVCYHVVAAARDQLPFPRDDDLVAEARHLANRLDAREPPRELHSSH